MCYREQKAGLSQATPVYGIPFSKGIRKTQVLLGECIGYEVVSQ
jgi:hypothetical protein